MLSKVAKIDAETRFAVKGWSGVAFRVISRALHCVEGEWVEDPESHQVVVVMVGDDHRYVVDEADLTPLAEEDYCPECGQIGCTGGRP